MATKKSTPDPRAGADILDTPDYKHLVDAFRRASGLSLHAYARVPGATSRSFSPPDFCRTLQTGRDCPLLFDPRYHVAEQPEIRVLCAGVGHVVIPVIAPDGTQLMNLVSDSARFGPVSLDEAIEKAFALKVVPDELVAQAEAVPLVDRERAMFAAHAMFGAMGELASGQPRRANALELMIGRVAAAPAPGAAQAILNAALEYTGAEFGYLTMVAADGSGAVDATTIATRAELWRILAGMAQWVLHAESPVETPNVAQSAWCRHLAGGDPPPAAICGFPLANNNVEGVYGSIVVGGANMAAISDWHDALGQFVDATRDAMVLCRRQIAGGRGDIVDASGAYNLRFIEELLEKEISRAGRFNHHLSVVVFHLDNYPELVKLLGPAGTEEVLAKLVDVIRANTRKVNSIARVGESAFVLVIPEADDTVADRIAAELTEIAQSTDYGLSDGKGKGRGKNKPLTLDLSTSTLTNPSGVLSALDHLSSPN